MALIRIGKSNWNSRESKQRKISWSIASKRAEASAISGDLTKLNPLNDLHRSTIHYVSSTSKIPGGIRSTSKDILQCMEASLVALTKDHCIIIKECRGQRITLVNASTG